MGHPCGKKRLEINIHKPTKACSKCENYKRTPFANAIVLTPILTCDMKLCKRKKNTKRQAHSDEIIFFVVVDDVSLFFFCSKPKRTDSKFIWASNLTVCKLFVLHKCFRLENETILLNRNGCYLIFFVESKRI